LVTNIVHNQADNSKQNMNKSLQKITSHVILDHYHTLDTATGTVIESVRTLATIISSQFTIFFSQVELSK